MKAKLIAASILVCANLLASPTALAQKKHPSKDDKADTHKHEVEVIDASTTAEGEKIRGPRSIKPTRVNRIHYRVEVKTKAKFTPGPSLALPFIPQVPGGDKAAAAGEKGAENDDKKNERRLSLRSKQDALPNRIDGEADFDAVSKAFDELFLFRASNIQSPIALAIVDTNRASATTKNFVLETDALLAGQGGPKAVLNGLADGGTLMTQLDVARQHKWPDEDINTFLFTLDQMENTLGRISVEWLSKPGNKERLDALLARIKTQRDEVRALSHNDDPDGKAAKFDAAQQSLSAWREIFIEARDQRESYFELPYVEAGCGFAFDQNKETEVVLVKQDRLAAAGSDPVEQSLVTVVCSSPLSISGGFGMSRIAEREFVFVPSTKTVTDNGQTTTKVINRFGFKNNSSFRMIPLLLLNTRIKEWNDTIALHMSAGAGVDIKTGEAGTDVEFIAGPTISFKRSMFITTGVHFGRVPKLAGGFQVGQEVPEGIDQPPVEKAWKPGFIIAITYKLK